MSEKRAAGGDDDDRLLRELRRLARKVDPVPEGVASYAKAALGWRRIDAELAELLSDSALESDSLALTRSGAGSARSVTFRASDLAIDLELRAGDPGILLLGQLAPPAPAAIEVQRDDAAVAATAEADELGRFRLELPEGGRIRLRVRRAAPAAAVETSWIDI
jgi:hypothetical protein